MPRSNLVINSDTVIKTYNKNFIHYYDQQKSLYHIIKDIKYVPHTSFSNNTITQQHAGIVIRNVQLTVKQKQTVKQQLIDLICLLHKNKIAHRDLHIDNICWKDNQIYVIDWEYICLHDITNIKQHYDITGKGLESPENTKHMNLLSKKKNSLKSYLNPVELNIGDFKCGF